MSWVTIAVFAILILFGVSGWRKGIISIRKGGAFLYRRTDLET